MLLAAGLRLGLLCWGSLSASPTLSRSKGEGTGREKGHGGKRKGKEERKRGEWKASIKGDLSPTTKGVYAVMKHVRINDSSVVRRRAAQFAELRSCDLMTIDTHCILVDVGGIRVKVQE